MKDPVIESKANELTSLVDRINVIMSELQDLNVEVRISYIDKNQHGCSTLNGPARQSIKLWKVEEHNGYI
jgi:hypothetical protein